LLSRGLRTRLERAPHELDVRRQHHLIESHLDPPRDLRGGDSMHGARYRRQPRLKNYFGGIAMGSVEVVLDCRAELGEGPVWDPEEHVLYWVNIKDHEIHRFDPASGEDTSWTTPADVGSLALRRSGGLVVALKTGFFFFDPEGVAFTAVAEPEPNLPDNRFNDGKTDRQGRFWAGSLYDPDETKPTGGLFRLDPDGSCGRMVDGIYASNALAFSPDSRTMYYGDSRRQIVWAWDFQAGDGAISNRRVFIELGPGKGVPDGAAVDFDGCYWLTQPPAGLVVRYDPTGRVDRVIEMPVSQPTCVAFGGTALDIPLHYLGQVQAAGGKTGDGAARRRALRATARRERSSGCALCGLALAHHGHIAQTVALRTAQSVPATARISYLKR